MLVLFSGAGFLYIIRHESLLKQTLLNNLNPYLKVPIRASKMELTLFRTFPALSVVFSDVVVPPASPEDPEDTLLYASRIYFKFNLFDLYAGRYDFRRIKIEKASLRIKIDPTGNGNYEIWNTTDTSSPVLKLTEVFMENLDISYLDMRSRVELTGRVLSLLSDGRFEKSRLDLFVDAKIKSTNITYRDIPYVQAADLLIKTSLAYNPDKDYFYFSNGIATLGGQLTAQLDGRIEPEVYEINLIAPDFILTDALVLIPATWQKAIEKLNPNGRCRGVAAIRGEKGKTASIVAGLELESGSFKLNDSEEPVIIEKLKTSYKVGPGFNFGGEWTMDTLSLRSDENFIHMQGSVKDITRPKISAKMLGNLAVKNLMAHLNIPNLSNAAGKINFRAHYHARLEHFDHLFRPTAHKGNWDAHINLRDGAFGYDIPKIDIHQIDASVLINGNDLEVSQLNFRRLDTDVSFIGVLYGFWQMFLEKQTGNLIGEMNAGEVNLAEWLPLFESTDGDSAAVAYKIYAEIRANIQKVKYLEFEAKDFGGNIKYNQSNWVANPVLADVFGGQFRGKIRLSPDSTGHRLSSVSSLKNVEISSLFRAFNDFGQKELNHRQIQGIANAEVIADLRFDKHMNLLPAKAEMQADLFVRNGRLLEYQTLQAISDYFGKNPILRKVFKAQSLSQRLRDVQFEQLSHHIEVKNQRVIIPQLTLRTNILDINVSGEHHFDLRYTYRFDLDISDLMTDRGPVSTEEGEVVDDGTGRLRVFLLMTGDKNSSEIQIDKASRSLYKSTKRKERGQEVKGALKQDFGLFGKDSTLKTREKALPSFEIEWDEATEVKKDSLNVKTKRESKARVGLFKRMRTQESEEEFLDADEYK